MSFGILIFSPIMSVIRSVIAMLSPGYRLTRHVRPAVEFAVSSIIAVPQMGCQLRCLLEYLLVVNSLHMCDKSEINESMAAGTKVFQIVEMNAIVLPMTKCLSLMISRVNAHNAMLNAR